MSEKKSDKTIEWELEYYSKQVEKAKKLVDMLSLGIFVELRDNFLVTDINATPDSVMEFLKEAALSHEVLNNAIKDYDATKKIYMGLRVKRMQRFNEEL